jgi:lipopolysaccharide assembly protein A
MNKLIWLLKWILKAAIFFTLFAFALNNQQEVTVHFFFGTRWHAPQVLVVLIVFAIGVAVGVLGMVPRWWRSARVDARAVVPQKAVGPLGSPSSATFPAIHDL